MSDGPDRRRLTPEERANLVAFIDGELTETESRALTTKLTQSATARREVELLKKTWEILDQLPRPVVNDQFHERTLSYVRAVELRSEKRFDSVKTAAAFALRGAACLATAVAVALVAREATKRAWANPDERLIRELSLAEHLDEYLEVGDFEFLERLTTTPEFGANH